MQTIWVVHFSQICISRRRRSARSRKSFGLQVLILTNRSIAIYPGMELFVKAYQYAWMVHALCDALFETWQNSLMRLIFDAVCSAASERTQVVSSRYGLRISIKIITRLTYSADNCSFLWWPRQAVGWNSLETKGDGSDITRQRNQTVFRLSVLC